MSSKSATLLQELRTRITDLDPNEKFTDSYLSRWLRARYWIVSDAETMLRNHLNWRRENEVDSVLERYKPPEVINNYFPGGFCGKDKLDRPLFVVPCGQLDTYNFMKCISRSTFLQNRIFLLEHIMQYVFPKSSRDAHCPVEQLTVIVDLQGLNRSHLSLAWFNYIRDTICMLELNYPEILGVCYVINAPSLFNLLFSFIRPLLNETTQEKILVLKANYQRVLLEHFDPEHLPQVYGGSMVDSKLDPKCSSSICWGGPIPDSYTRHLHFKFNSKDIPSIPDHLFSVVNVGRGSLQNITIGFLTSGTRLILSISCDSFDIGVGLFFKLTETRQSDLNSMENATLDRSTDQRNMSEMIPVQRFVKDDYPVKADYVIPFSAIYYLRLDNSYSWMRSKTVRFAFQFNQTSLNDIPEVIPVQAHRGMLKPI